MSLARLSHLLFHLLVCLSACTGAQAGEAAAFFGKPTCRIAPLAPPPLADAVSWFGACKDGYADGKGVLAWEVASKGLRRLEATVVRGEVVGQGTLTDRDGSYTGTFRQGMPHGTGFFKYANGDMYEGGVANGLHEGSGVYLAADGSSYEGEWQADKRHGRGKASFALGGSYEGEWRNGKMHGHGKIVYSSGRTYAGEFRDDRALGAAPLPAPEGEPERYGLKADQPLTGSNMLHNVAFAETPLDATWEALSPAQKAQVRSSYPALDDGDEPPYPLKGTRAFIKGVSSLYSRFTDYRGDALLYVTVGPDGVPTSASTYGVSHREFGRTLSVLAMMQRFKPARCAGKPCAMIYPIKFRFTVQ